MRKVEAMHVPPIGTWTHAGDINRERRRRQTGFTLIELLVTLAIVGLLSAIALYAVQNSLAKARASRIIADMATIRNALVQHYADTNQYNPGNDQTTNQDTGEFLRPYLGTNTSLLRTKYNRNTERQFFVYYSGGCMCAVAEVLGPYENYLTRKALEKAGAQSDCWNGDYWKWDCKPATLSKYRFKAEVKPPSAYAGNGQICMCIDNRCK